MLSSDASEVSIDVSDGPGTFALFPRPHTLHIKDMGLREDMAAEGISEDLRHTPISQSQTFSLK